MDTEDLNKKADKIMNNIRAASLNFSGGTAERSPWHDDWLRFTDRPWYNLMRSVMINNGIGQGDAENILANAWEDGWTRAREAFNDEN